MKTPKEYNEKVVNKILDSKIISHVLFSLNKRAKNCRDKKQEFYDKADQIRRSNRYVSTDIWHKGVQSYKEKTEEYYQKKDFILKTLFEPIEIHEINDSHFLYYEINGYGFHSPSKNDDLNLPIKSIEDFSSLGKDFRELLSVQFCDKVIDLIKNKKFQIIEKLNN